MIVVSGHGPQRYHLQKSFMATYLIVLVRHKQAHTNVFSEQSGVLVKVFFAKL